MQVHKRVCTEQTGSFTRERQQANYGSEDANYNYGAQVRTSYRTTTRDIY
jgi:hypothetical protein